MYVAEGTPWFLTHPITCVAHLANINMLATGCYDKMIYLWDMRNSNQKSVSPGEDSLSKTSSYSKSKGKSNAIEPPTKAEQASLNVPCR